MTAETATDRGTEWKATACILCECNCGILVKLGGEDGCPTARRSSSTPRSSAARDSRPTACAAPRRAPSARSRGRGRTDLKDRRIRVNAVSPGSIDTPGLNDLLASSETGQQRAKMIAATVPLGRFGRPEEIAKAMVFLASDDSSYVTGIELFVDGGFAQV